MNVSALVEDLLARRAKVPLHALPEFDCSLGEIERLLELVMVEAEAAQSLIPSSAGAASDAES